MPVKPPSSLDLWSAVDEYFSQALLETDAILDAVLAASEAAGLPSHNVSPSQGKLLQILALLRAARSVLEIGTLGGYSAIWLARGLAEGGRLVTLEADARYAEVARANFARAGLGARIDLRVGRALESLPRLAAEGRGPFDLVFSDADKESNVEYFDWALRLSRPGTLIVVDNVVRDGKVLDPASKDPAVQGVRRLNERVAREPRVSATALQTVGRKGWDGMELILVRA